MASKKKKFDPTGDLCCQVVRYLIHKAKEALAQGINASEGDFLTWATFVRDCESLAQSIADNHPGGQHDYQRLARSNYNRQASKFIDWLGNGRGYPKTFAARAGLVDSKLGGTEGDIQAGSDNDISDHESDGEGEELPIADQRQVALATPQRLARVTPGRSTGKKPAFDLRDITERLDDIFEDIDKNTMQIVTVVEENVTIKGFGGTSFHDVLLLQALLVGGAVVSTIKVDINKDDPSGGVVSVDQDPHVIVGMRRIKKEYRLGNKQLALKFEAKLDLACKAKFAVDGAVPPHSKVQAPFSWPAGLKSQLNPVDPYVLGFRSFPASPGQTLFDTKAVKAKGSDNRVVSAMLLTAFYFVEKHTHINNFAGSGLRCEGPSDSDSDGSHTPRNASRPKGSPAASSTSNRSSSNVQPQYNQHSQKKRKGSPAATAAAATSSSGVQPMEEEDELSSDDPNGPTPSFYNRKPAPTYAVIPPSGNSVSGASSRRSKK